MKSVDRDSVAQYMAEVGNIPVLSREDEHALALRAKTEPAAAAELARANLRYVVAIAIGYRRYGVRVGDLVSEGNVGLMIALAKFDPSRGTRFVTYAAHWIRAMILDHVIKSHSMVGLGSGPMRSKVFFRLRRERAKIAAATSDAEEASRLLAERFGTTTEKIEAMAARLESRDVSVDAKTHDDGAGTLLDSFASPLPSQEDELSRHEQTERARARVQAALGELDARERVIIELRMMADEPEELSLAELGRKLGVSRERARQLESRAKSKLHRLLAADFAPTGAIATGLAAPSPSASLPRLPVAAVGARGPDAPTAAPPRRLPLPPRQRAA